MLSVRAQEAAAERITVRADRLPDVDAGAPFAVRMVDAGDLQRAPELRLDDILRAQVPGFSLFRRSSSRTANPTAQGVTLRNFGPSGAGRTLVLLDGIPLNDPFGGYVLWSQVPPSSVHSVLIQPGGGAGLFGNAALAGTIFLLSKPLDETTAAGAAAVGDHDTYEVSVEGSAVHAPLAVGVYADHFSTAGYPVIAAGQRGRVDTRADSESDLVDLRADAQINHDTSVRLRGRWFRDDRGNGTRYTHNDTAGQDLSIALTQKFPAQSSALELSLYTQRRKFRSTFSSINAARDVEVPALDQFHVPASALGGSAVWTASLGQHRLTLGGDARAIEGETDEHFLWRGRQFTRLREAGGQQLFLGAFAEDSWAAGKAVTVVGGVRYDHWELSDGFRRESDLATGLVRTNLQYADRTGDEWNGRLGVRIAATKALALRTAGYTGFRVPTLNELYRPFRVGNDVTEANPALKPERLIGGEAGVDWQVTRTLRLTGTGFLNRLDDAVGNLTVGAGPGTFVPGGFIPRGGILRQRENIDRIIAPGAEASGEWQIVPQIALRLGYLVTRPTVARDRDSALVGKLLPQTPEHVFTAGMQWTPTARWRVDALMRFGDRQFEDDQNARGLASVLTVDAGVSYEISSRVSAALHMENLTDTQVETGKSATGVVAIGAPRSITLQMRWRL